MPRPSSNTARTRTACIVLWVRNIAPPSPVETLQGGANSRTKPRRLDAREVLVTAGQESCFSFLWRSVRGISPSDECRWVRTTASSSRVETLQDEDDSRAFVAPKWGPISFLLAQNRPHLRLYNTCKFEGVIWRNGIAYPGRLRRRYCGSAEKYKKSHPCSLIFSYTLISLFPLSHSVAVGKYIFAFFVISN